MNIEKKLLDLKYFYNSYSIFMEAIYSFKYAFHS